MSDKLHFLVLATGKPSRYLVDAINKRGHTYEHHEPDNLYLYVSESENGYDRIYNGSPNLETPVRIKAKSFDSIISRIGNGLDYGATILQHLNENLGIYSPQTADALLTARDKMKTTQRLSSSGVKVPLTVFAKRPVHIQFLIDKIGGLPAVGKLLKGSQGQGVMIFRDAEQTNTSLESFWKLMVDVKLQRYIESNKTDVRAIVVGDKVAVAMERTGNRDFRANISQGGSGRKIELSTEQKNLCIRAAKALGLEFAGVDLIQDEEGRSYIVEVNGNPGTKIIDITGHNYFVDLVSHIEKKVGSNENSSQKTSAQATGGMVRIKITNSASSVNDEPKQYLSFDELNRDVKGMVTAYQLSEFLRLFTGRKSTELQSMGNEGKRTQIFKFVGHYFNQKSYPNLSEGLSEWSRRN